MKITEIIKDIFDDVNTTDQRHEDFLRDTGSLSPRYRRRGSLGMTMLFLPQILGFVLGLAVAKLIGGGYLIFGLIGAFCVGTYKSISFDKITMKYALLRNAIIMGLIFVLAAIVVLPSLAD